MAQEIASRPDLVVPSWMVRNLGPSIYTIVGLSVLAWVVRFVRFRQSYKKLAPSLPAPPFSILLGSIKAMAEMYAHAPTDCHPHGVFTMMQRKYKLKGMWFMDTWPASPQRQLVIADPNLAAQTTQINNLPKNASMEQYAGHIAGPRSMIFTEGATWKKSRSLFNSSFSLTHLMTLVPSIVDDALIYRQVIGEHADSGDVRPIEEALARLMIDIMGHIVLDFSLNSQTTKNEFVEAFRSQISWTPSAVSTNPFVNLNPLRPFAHKYYTRKMNNYLEKVLVDRFLNLSRDSTKSRRKPAIDLALDEYTEQQKEENVTRNERGVDKAFKANAIDQMKSFIFAGHDTTSSTMAYTYLLLSQHPEQLGKARAELDSVFGADPSKAANLIKQNPNLVNSLPFMLGILRETLRLFSPVMTVREGKGSINYEGITYDINGCMVFEVCQAIHRNAEYFPHPDKFIPERWIPGSNSFQEIPKDAFRPFEKGPRDCIGQQLAMLEMKIVLALTLREFDFKEDYETWDKGLGRKRPGDQLDGRRGMFGQRAYQQLVASAKPADGLPGKFLRRKQSKVVHVS